MSNQVVQLVARWTTLTAQVLSVRLRAQVVVPSHLVPVRWPNHLHWLQAVVLRLARLAVAVLVHPAMRHWSFELDRQLATDR